MVTDSSVYLAFFGCRLTQIVIMVMAPSLPVNIKKIKIHRAAMPSPGVMPVDSPAVLKADTVSKKSCMKVSSGSATHIRKVPTQTIRAEQITIMDALDTFSFGILLRNAPTGRLENSLRTDCSNTNIVLVFTPPPVEPEDAPMNMRIQITNSPPLLKLPREQVENPAVLADMLWKNAAIQEMGSVNFKSSVPPANKIPVVTSTTFV